jgi:hypothetical protein
LAVKDNNSDPNKDEENYLALLKRIYQQFPEAIWEKDKEGFKIFV